MPKSLAGYRTEHHIDTFLPHINRFENELDQRSKLTGLGRLVRVPSITLILSTQMADVRQQL
jgi:hypothetical protein